MNVGILGAGRIAAIMAKTINGMGDEAVLYAVSSRDSERAGKFASDWGVKKAYGSYEEMLGDDNVDLVYIAVPHSHHHRWTLEALKAGKNVLCEKSFAANSSQAKEMIEYAEEKKLLLTEAIWTRYMPSRQIINDMIDKGAIGEVLSVDSNLGYKIDFKERMVKLELAGGCLLDLTVYPLNFSSMILGNDIKKINASMILTETGVDGQDNVMIEYNDGRMATCFTSMFALSDRRGLICGSEGFISVQNINNPEKITVYDAQYSVKEEITVPEQITGYEYEVLACRRAIEENRIECPEMPHSETLEIMRQMDLIREQFGIVFPFEK